MPTNRLIRNNLRSASPAKSTDRRRAQIGWRALMAELNVAYEGVRRDVSLGVGCL
jgi:hypothetical protein